MPSSPGRRTALVLGVLAVALIAAGPAQDAGGEQAGAPVRLAQQRLLGLRVSLGSRSPEERARAASDALARVLERGGEEKARVVQAEGGPLVAVGDVQVLQLTAADAAAEGVATPEDLASSFADRLNRALAQERRRAAVSSVVFSFSLLVFSALIAFLLVRRVAVLEEWIERSLESRRVMARGLRVQNVEVLHGEALRGAATVALRVGRFLGQLAIAYTWVVFALALFPATRGAGAHLTRMVLSPAETLLARIGRAVPIVAMMAVAALALWLLLRAVNLFFRSVARGETVLRGVPPHLAPPLGVLLRIGILALALVFAAPLLTGSDSGVFSWLAIAALAAMALGASPLVASAALGARRIFDRTIRPGDRIETRGLSGRVTEVSLLDLQLEDESGARVRVPHLVSFFQPIRILGSGPGAAVRVAVDPAADAAAVRQALLEAAGPGGAVDLLSLDAGAARYRVRGSAADLPVRLAEALRQRGIGLGRPPEPEPGE
jgi:small-conductance mechanosensitive channel